MNKQEMLDVVNEVIDDANRKVKDQEELIERLREERKAILIGACILIFILLIV
ncbi:MAG: hypothetical protein AB8E74_07880 [Prochlorococcus sp.]|nr:hypothetical protein [Prochlorococcaceae cyanobacterium Fu_MAG_50]